LVDSLPTLIAVWDLDLKCRFANHAHSHWFDRDYSQIQGISLQEILGRKSFAQAEAKIRAALAGQPQHFEESIVNDDGSRRTFLVTCLPSIVDGAITGIFTHTVDVGRVKKAEDALHEEISRHRDTIASLARAADRIACDEETFRRTLRLNGQIPLIATGNFRISLISDHWVPDWIALTGGNVSADLDVHIADFIYADDLERAREDAQRAVASPSVTDGRYRIVRKDGALRWMRFRVAPDFDEAGNLTQWLGTIEDVDDLVRAEERASEIDAAYRQTIELHGQILWTAPPEGGVLTISEHCKERWHALTARPTRFDLTNYVPDLMHPDDLVGAFRGAAQRLAAGTTIDQRYRLRAPDGKYRWFRSRAVPRRDEQGAIIAWYGTLEDVHDQVAEEERRRELDAVYRLTIELSGMLPWSTEMDGWKISIAEDVAPRWTALTGRPVSTPIGEYITRAIHPDDVASSATSRLQAIAAGRALDHRYRLQMADGSYRWWRSRGSPLRDEAGDVVRWYGTLEDIHDQVMNEQRVQRLEFELAHFARVAAMNSLASTLAHELSQPLAAVANYVSGAQRLIRSGSTANLLQISEALTSAAAATQRSGEIVRGMRSMVAKGGVDRQPENVARLIERAGLLAMADAKANGIDYRIEIDPDVDTAWVDRIQLEQVFINLLRNAVEAVATMPVRTIALKACLAGSEVHISVSDSGPGVAPEIIGNLFGAFNSTKPDGLGVGLSICRTIVEANGGRILYAANPANGACFTVCVPIRE
jgi:PAS domain S-box-containing protein